MLLRSPASFPFERVGGSNADFKKIAELINRDKSQPYCLVVTSHCPHLPWSEGDATVYNAQELTIPPYLVDMPQTGEVF